MGHGEVVGAKPSVGAHLGAHLGTCSRVPGGVLAHPPPTNRTPPKFWGLNQEPELAVATVTLLLIGIEVSLSQRVASIVAHTAAPVDHDRLPRPLRSLLWWIQH